MPRQESTQASRHREFMSAFSPAALPAQKRPASFGTQPLAGGKADEQGVLFDMHDPGENGERPNHSGPLNPGFAGLWDMPGPENTGMHDIEEKANGLPQPHVAETVRDFNGEDLHLATYLHGTDNVVHYDTGSGKPLPQGITYAFKKNEDSGEYQTVGYLSTYHPQQVSSPTMTDPDKTLPYREVSGLGVDPEERGSGIAVSMVKHAYKAIGEHEGEHLAGSTELSSLGRQFSKKVAANVGDVRNETGDTIGDSYGPPAPTQAILPGMEDSRNFDEQAVVRADHARTHEPRLRALGATDSDVATHLRLTLRGTPTSAAAARSLEGDIVENTRYTQEHGNRLRAMGASQRALRMHRAAWDVGQADTAQGIEDMVKSQTPGWHEPAEAEPAEPASTGTAISQSARDAAGARAQDRRDAMRGRLPEASPEVEQSNQLNSAISAYMDRNR